MKGYGRGEESWTIDRHIIYNDPAIGTDQHGSPWAALDEYLSQPISHESGAALPIQSVAIDSGGHHTQQVYNYTRTRSHRNVFAVKGPKPAQETHHRQAVRHQCEPARRKDQRQKLWLVGTDTAKALIYGRMRMIEVGPGYCHYSKDLPPDEFEQLTAERLVTRYIKGSRGHGVRQTRWQKKRSARLRGLRTCGGVSTRHESLERCGLGQIPATSGAGAQAGHCTTTKIAQPSTGKNRIFPVGEV